MRHIAHIALAIAVCAVIAAALPSPGLFVALGLGIAAIGALGGLLGGLRVVLVLAAIDHLAGMLGQ